jgi:hypothetical protein
LQKIAECVRAIWSPLRTNDAVSHGFLKSEWITNGQNKVPSLHCVRIRQLERFDAGIIDLEHSQIDLRIRAHQPRFFRPAIAQLHFNLIHLIDNVIVRDDMSLVGHNHTRAERILHHGLVVWVPELPLLVAKEKLERIEAVLPTDLDLLGRFHRDDGRDHATDERAALPVQGLKRCDLLWIDIRR